MPFEAINESGLFAVSVQTGDAPVAMLGEDKAPVRIEGQTIRSRLDAFESSLSGVAARLQKYAGSFAFAPLDDRIRRYIREEQIAFFAVPNRAFHPLPSADDSLHFDFKRNQLVESGIETNNVDFL